MENQIVGENNKNISSPAVSPQANLKTNYVDIFSQLEQTIESDFQKVKAMMQQGVINQNQGQILMDQLAKKAYEINKYKNAVSEQNKPSENSNSSQPLPPKEEAVNSLEKFIKTHPDFFTKGGRKAVLEYIKNLDMDEDEILQIAKIVEALETSAVDSYLKQSAHEKSLNDENSIAKSKLTAYAQNTSSNGNIGRIFTREDIGRMSGDEFTKNEKLIMDQVKKGLIK